MAARARRLARTVGDKRTETELLTAAHEYDAKAAALEQDARKPSNRRNLNKLRSSNSKFNQNNRSKTRPSRRYPAKARVSGA